MFKGPESVLYMFYKMETPVQLCIYVEVSVSQFFVSQACVLIEQEYLCVQFIETEAQFYS